jgi:hypothetical protein|uniref:MIF4G domain-containing protein n=1 Tax=viral metagenome TaxID=1070528 RepID=A0A6C0D9R7_9ZZZZ
MGFRYTLKDFTEITFNGFNIKLPEETLITITELSQQVGSPTYIRTPTFQKIETKHILKTSSDGFSNNTNLDFKRKKRNKPVEILNDDDWETIRTFQTTKIEQKVGVEAQIDVMRSWLNKMSDKLFIEPCEKIMEVLNQLIIDGVSDSDMLRVGNIIFEIASNNRFYSKLYADLYSKLIQNYDVMKYIFNQNLDSFMELFDCIEYVNPETDYDKFCKINVNNERRKALSLFFVNLTNHKVITEEKLLDMTCSLLKNLIVFIKEDGRKNEVDEITENIAIFYSYNKKLFESCEDKFDGMSFNNTIEMLANSKAKTFPSLSNKSIFKFMDLVEM